MRENNPYKRLLENWTGVNTEDALTEDYLIDNNVIRRRVRSGHVPSSREAHPEGVICTIRHYWGEYYIANYGVSWDKEIQPPTAGRPTPKLIPGKTTRDCASADDPMVKRGLRKGSLLPEVKGEQLVGISNWYYSEGIGFTIAQKGQILSALEYPPTMTDEAESWLPYLGDSRPKITCHGYDKETRIWMITDEDQTRGFPGLHGGFAAYTVLLKRFDENMSQWMVIKRRFKEGSEMMAVNFEFTHVGKELKATGQAQVKFSTISLTNHFLKIQKLDMPRGAGFLTIEPCKVEILEPRTDYRQSSGMSPLADDEPWRTRFFRHGDLDEEFMTQNYMKAVLRPGDRKGIGKR